MELVRVSNVSLNLEGIQILSDVDMTFEEGLIHAVIGPNGAGKTSLMNCITGYYPPNEGSVIFQGQDITRLRPDRIARLGIARMFQHIEIISELSVKDNILLGRHIHTNYNISHALLYYGKARQEELRNEQEITEIVSFLQLEDVREKIAGSLSYGTQKRVELARAIAAMPKILILDEPTSGMNQQEKTEIIHAILKVHESFIPSILLIEHDMRVVMEISDRISVMNFGTLIAEGCPGEIQENQLVIEAYLGTEGTC
jgi:branched-chain amino acid transport system ATP-binding protein